MTFVCKFETLLAQLPEISSAVASGRFINGLSEIIQRKEGQIGTNS